MILVLPVALTNGYHGGGGIFSGLKAACFHRLVRLFGGSVLSSNLWPFKGNHFGSVERREREILFSRFVENNNRALCKFSTATKAQRLIRVGVVCSRWWWCTFHSKDLIKNEILRNLSVTTNKQTTPNSLGCKLVKNTYLCFCCLICQL